MNLFDAFNLGFLVGIFSARKMSADKWKEQKRKQRRRLTEMSADTEESIYKYTNTKKDSSLSADKESAEAFERFWKTYPKRRGANPKYPARLKFLREVKKGVDPAAIIAGATRYAIECDPKLDTEWVCMAVTWLNQRRWEDYPLSQTNALSREEFREKMREYEENRARRAEERRAREREERRRRL